jgi:mycothiol synthase
LQHLERLSTSQQSAVLELIAQTTAIDGTPPIAEHILLHLRHGGDKSDSHLLIENSTQVIGYAHIDQTDLVAGPSVELVVAPDHRVSDVGEKLLSEAIKICGNKIRLWVHGQQGATHTLATSHNFEKIRTVLQMSRSLAEIQQLPVIDPKVTIRSFLPAIDNQPWLELNNLVFKDHPEQGGWGLSDLNHRVNEEWFDEKGFYIAERDNQMIGFTWTKIHGAHSHDHGGKESAHAHPAIGEIYITAISPSFAGAGIGKALTITALNYLKYQGLADVILYVDAENQSAINLYQSLGFKEFGKDLLFKLQLA